MVVNHTHPLERAFRYYAFLFLFLFFITLLDPFIGSIRYPSKLEWHMERFDKQTNNDFQLLTTYIISK